jgi:FAD/FMN-containing dehydrogenase
LLNRHAAEAVFQRVGMTPSATTWAVIVGYEGNEEAVRWQVQKLVMELGAASHLDARVGFPAQPLWTALTECAGGAEAKMSFKANVLPSTVADFCRAVDCLPERPVLQAHAASGIVRGHWAEVTKARAGELRSAWRTQAERGQGSVVVERCPSAWKRSIPVWDAIPDGWLMRTIKEKFDPRRTFNPGRFVEGI